MKFGTKNALFGYFWDEIWKNYCHNIWNQHPRICQDLFSFEVLVNEGTGPSPHYKHYIPCSSLNDLSMAFDIVHHQISIKKLQHYGIDSIPLEWFVSYLSYRKQIYLWRYIPKLPRYYLWRKDLYSGYIFS